MCTDWMPQANRLVAISGRRFPSARPQGDGLRWEHFRRGMVMSPRGRELGLSPVVMDLVLTSLFDVGQSTTVAEPLLFWENFEYPYGNNGGRPLLSGGVCGWDPR